MSSLSNSLKSQAILREDEEYVDGIVKGLQSSHPIYAREVKRRLQVASEKLGVWYELMVYDWLWKLGKSPFPQPSAPGGSKPDFIFTAQSKKIYIDVASVQESEKDKDIFESEEFLSSQSTSSYAAMRERFIDKAGKHKSIAKGGNAYVICLGLESPWIDADDAKSCFIGNEAYNIPSGRLTTAMDGEIFEVEDNGSFLTKYKSVSAILVAKRNYSIEKDRNKLDFWLIQNPYANEKIQPTEFGEISSFAVIDEKEKFFRMGWQ